MEKGAMNILHIPPYAPPMRGGSELFAFGLASEQKRRGHYTEIWCSHWPKSTPKIGRIGGIPVYRFMTVAYLMDVNPLSFFWGYVLKRAGEFDVLHAHSYIYFLVNQVAFCRWLKRFPFVLHLHGGIGYMPIENFGILNTLMKTGYDLTIGPATIARTDAIIACSESDKRKAVKVLGADPEKVTVIPNAIDVETFWLDEPNIPTVTYIGRITALKGATDFPRIVREVSKRIRMVRFNFIGKGNMEEQVKETCRNYNVHFYGSVPHEDIPYYLSMTSVLILPSRMEGMPLVVLEAMAASKPCVAYDVGGVAEAVIDNVTGYCLRAGNLNGFIDRVCYLLENDMVRRSVGKTGRSLVEKKHTWGNASKAVMEVYRRVI